MKNMEMSLGIPVFMRNLMKMTELAAGALACGATGAVTGKEEADLLAVSGKTIKYAGKDIPLLFRWISA